MLRLSVLALLLVMQQCGDVAVTDQPGTTRESFYTRDLNTGKCLRITSENPVRIEIVEERWCQGEQLAR